MRSFEPVVARAPLDRKRWQRQHVIDKRNLAENLLASVVWAPCAFLIAWLTSARRPMPRQQLTPVRPRHPDLSISRLGRLSLLLALALNVLMLSACGEEKPTTQIAGADAGRGKTLIQRYGCVACHSIPGIAGHGSNVGPPLEKMGRRGYVGGVLPNTPDDMVRWLRNPPAVDPRTAMPNLGISEAEAKDIAAYLYTLR